MRETNVYAITLVDLTDQTTEVTLNIAAQAGKLAIEEALSTMSLEPYSFREPDIKAFRVKVRNVQGLAERKKEARKP